MCPGIGCRRGQTRDSCPCRGRLAGRRHPSAGPPSPPRRAPRGQVARRPRWRTGPAGRLQCHEHGIRPGLEDGALLSRLARETWCYRRCEVAGCDERREVVVAEHDEPGTGGHAIPASWSCVHRRGNRGTRTTSSVGVPLVGSGDGDPPRARQASRSRCAADRYSHDSYMSGADSTGPEVGDQVGRRSDAPGRCSSRCRPSAGSVSVSSDRSRDAVSRRSGVRQLHGRRSDLLLADAVPAFQGNHPSSRGQ